MKNTISRNIFLFSFIVTIILFSAVNGLAQEKVFTYENFEDQILGYYPKMRKSLDEKYFRKGEMFLRNTYSAIKSKGNNFVYADYWNIANGFMKMGEKKEYIEIAFKKAVEKDSSTVCELIFAFNGEKDITEHDFYRSIPEVYTEFYKTCADKNPKDEVKFDLDNYAGKNKLDKNLVKTIAEIEADDQLYRKEKGLYFNDPTKLKKQTELDEKNQRLIEELFVKHSKYVGKSLVGEKLESVMWLVIQHSNLKMMEKYLGIVHQAVKDEELKVGALKLLIDRIYTIKTKKQIFGSQEGVDFADGKTIRETKQKFNIQYK